MEILRLYGLGPNLHGILKSFGDDQAVFPKVGMFYGRPFRTDRVGTQGGPSSPTIFKNVVDAEVRAVLLEFCGLQETQHGLEWSEGEHNIVLYVEKVRIAGRNPI